MKLQRSVETATPPAAVFAYLSDFTTTNEWDPGTVRTTLLSGDGGVGTKYHNVSKFAGRETELTYEVIENTPDSRFVVRGENKTVVALDTIDIEPVDTGSRVTYTADFEFSGVAKYFAPLLAPACKKLGDEAEQGLRDALNQL